VVPARNIVLKECDNVENSNFVHEKFL
jgi:hypothetical protein